MSGKTERGISLFEATVALFLAGVMVLCMAPVFFRMVNDHRVVAYSNELVGALRFARSQAVDQVAPVTLCSSADGHDCSATPWTQGYIAFIDQGEPGIVDGDDQVLKSVTTSTPYVIAQLQGVEYVRFHSNGALIAGLPAGADWASPPERTMLSRTLEALLPVASAHATDLPVLVAQAPATFLVCSGVMGRAVNVTSLGHVRTDSLECK